MEANLRPIPPPHDEDNEDVHWALSTATALWGRGERDEALKWLRRAAEQASDANADLRALELFKAAAEVAQKIAAIEGDPAAGAEPPTASAPPNAAASAPGHASGAPPATASAPPPRPSAPGAASFAARPSWPPGAEAGRAERSGASAPPAAMRAPSVRAPAGDAPPGPITSAAAMFRDVGVPRPAAVLGRPASVAPGRAPAPVSQAALREVTPTQLSPATRAPGPTPGLPARPAAATKSGAPPAAAASTAGSHGRGVPANARAITGFAASPHGRVSSTTAVTEEVPAVKLPAAGALAGQQEPGQGAADAARDSASGEQQPTDADPPIDQRATVPTSTAMAAALARRPGTPLGASSSQDATERRPRLWPEGDDEGTTRRPLTPQEQRVLMELRIEDLDEETPMLPQDLAGDGKPAAVPRDAPEGAHASDDRADWTEAEPDDADDGIASVNPQGDPTLAGEPSDAVQGEGAEEGAASWSQGAPTDDRGRSAADSSWSEPPYEGEWQAPPPRLPASQIEPLPALRVAVIGISSAGELRLVPMDGRNAPPRGAALGILVPLTAGDGETIARLLQLRG
ncbi:hypothetical protein WME90_18520 [Sorangium sp. So ce375]|uniref:hypothetical protein n=1 Tax=Sorangium sp. So ce375 TaxID=3133306 RepID=UPI003F5BCF20